MNLKQYFKVPRSLIPIVWAIIVSFIQIAMPWLISRMGLYHGWINNTPGPWNLFGLLFVVIGIAAYTICLVFHFKTYTGPVRAGWTPPRLVTHGPYRFSRNPMYIAAFTAWLGWVIFFGNLPVLIALCILDLVFFFVIVPREEKQLEKLFGDEYLSYKQAVPRWLGHFVIKDPS